MFSVIIPTSNRMNNVFLVLAALETQTVPKDQFEVIVSDDGSTDLSHALLSGERPKETNGLRNYKYAWAYKKDEWNASRPRNFGAKLAEKDSEFFVFVDSDVLLNPNALEAYVEDYGKNPDRVVIGPYHWLHPMKIGAKDVRERWGQVVNETLPGTASTFGDLGYIGKDTRMMSFDKAKGPDDLFGELFDGLACFGGNLMVPKKIFWKAGGYDENIFCGCEDGDFGLTLWELGVKFSYDIRTVGYHVWHERSAFRTQNARPEVDKLNRKHFGTTDQKLIDYSKEAYRRWGFPDWQPPPQWITEEGEEK